MSAKFQKINKKSHLLYSSKLFVIEFNKSSCQI